MTQRKSHIDKNTFGRYLTNQMTPAERNVFEKELQKNPFEAEALEGFEMVSSSDLQNDLRRIKAQLIPSRRKKRTTYYAAAATILLLVTAGVIWIQLAQQNPIPQMSETKIKSEKIQQNPAVPTSPQPKAIKETPKAPFETQAEEHFLPAEKSVRLAPTEIKVATKTPALKAKRKETINNIDVRDVNNYETTKLANAKASFNEAEEISTQKVAAAKDRTAFGARLNTEKLASRSNTIRGKIISAEDKMPLPGVSVVVKGTSKGAVSAIDGTFELQLDNDSNSILVASFIGMESREFAPDTSSNNLIALEASRLALDEVVVVGYGTQQKVIGSVHQPHATPLNHDAKPNGGYTSFYAYLNENAVLTNSHPEKKVVVKLKLEIDATGKITAITNANKSDKTFFSTAKQLVVDGPAWLPKYVENRKVESMVKVRVVFRKKHKTSNPD